MTPRTPAPDPAYVPWADSLRVADLLRALDALDALAGTGLAVDTADALRSLLDDPAARPFVLELARRVDDARRGPAPADVLHAVDALRDLETGDAR